MPTSTQAVTRPVRSLTSTAGSSPAATPSVSSIPSVYSRQYARKRVEGRRTRDQGLRRGRSRERLGSRAAGDKQRDESDARKSGGRIKRVLIIASGIVDTRADGRPQDPGRAPRREQQAVVGAKVACAIHVGGRGGENRELCAIAPVGGHDEQVEEAEVLSPDEERRHRDRR